VTTTGNGDGLPAQASSGSQTAGSLRRRQVLAAAGVTLVGGLAGCGSNGSSGTETDTEDRLRRTRARAARQARVLLSPCSHSALPVRDTEVPPVGQNLAQDGTTVIVRPWSIAFSSSSAIALPRET
jgi:hypothetical protein